MFIDSQRLPHLDLHPSCSFIHSPYDCGTYPSFAVPYSAYLRVPLPSSLSCIAASTVCGQVASANLVFPLPKTCLGAYSFCPFWTSKARSQFHVDRLAFRQCVYLSARLIIKFNHVLYWECEQCMHSGFPYFTFNTLIKKKNFVSLSFFLKQVRGLTLKYEG